MNKAHSMLLPAEHKAAPSPLDLAGVVARKDKGNCNPKSF